MFRNYIQSPDQALVHLAFHCSLKDGELQQSELDFLTSTFVAKGINKELNLKEESQHYHSYYKDIRDEAAFLQYLLEVIRPKNKLALFAFCTEIVYRDNNVSISEEVLLNKVASLLYIKDQDNLTVQNLVTELNDVERNNAF